ncbi:MAG TPA: RNA polymerase sigma factor [Sphingomicrobium sp.]|nr:RNA polymerase sigma factor [Sphingomicrobium sp.]
MVVANRAGDVLRETSPRLSLCQKGWVLAGDALQSVLDEATLNAWFCTEVLPLERALTSFIRRNWRVAADVTDLRQDIYERALAGARPAIPTHTRRYLFTVARNHLINCAKRGQVVSIELVADTSALDLESDAFGTERQLTAREELRRTQQGLDQLPPRCREVIWLRKVEGLSTRETAERLGIGLDTVEKQITQGMRALVDFMLGGDGKIRRPLYARRRSRSELR